MRWSKAVHYKQTVHGLQRESKIMLIIHGILPKFIYIMKISYLPIENDITYVISLQWKAKLPNT